MAVCESVTECVLVSLKDTVRLMDSVCVLEPCLFSTSLVTDMEMSEVGVNVSDSDWDTVSDKVADVETDSLLEPLAVGSRVMLDDRLRSSERLSDGLGDTDAERTLDSVCESVVVAVLVSEIDSLRE